MSRIHIGLVDGSVVTRAVLRSFLERADDMVFVGEVENCSAAADLIEQTEPHVVVVCLGFKEAGELEFLQYLNEVSSSVRILVLASFIDPYLEELMLNLGAAAFMLKDEAASALIPTIRYVVTRDTDLDLTIDDN